MKLDVAVGTMDASIRSMKSMRLYDRVERVLKELEAAGFAPDQPLTVQDLSPFDHMHYCGTAAVDHAIADCRIGPGQKVVEIGSGVGGPARWVAATTGAEVTALELQSDLNALAMTLTARTGLGPRVHHLCANILDGPPPGAPFDHALSFLCFLHIPDRSRLFSVIDSVSHGQVALYRGFRRAAYRIVRRGGGARHQGHVPLCARPRPLCERSCRGRLYHRQMRGPHRPGVTSPRAGCKPSAPPAPHKEAMLGVDLAAGLEDFYAVMAELFAASAIGGLQIKASRQIGRGSREVLRILPNATADPTA